MAKFKKAEFEWTNLGLHLEYAAINMCVLDKLFPLFGPPICNKGLLAQTSSSANNLTLKNLFASLEGQVLETVDQGPEY